MNNRKSGKQPRRTAMEAEISRIPRRMLERLYLCEVTIWRMAKDRDQALEEIDSWRRRGIARQGGSHA